MKSHDGTTPLLENLRLASGDCADTLRATTSHATVSIGKTEKRLQGKLENIAADRETGRSKYKHDKR